MEESRIGRLCLPLDTSNTPTKSEQALYLSCNKQEKQKVDGMVAKRCSRSIGLHTKGVTFRVLFFPLLLLSFSANRLGAASLQREHVRDSLYNVIRSNSPMDTSRILAEIDLAYQYRVSDADSCRHYALLALRKSEEQDFAKGVGRSINVLGLWHYNLNQYDSAAVYFRRSIDILANVPDNQGLALGKNNLGLVHELRGAPGEALESYFEALGLLEEIQDQANQSIVLNNIALLLIDLEEYDQAVEYLHRNLALDSLRGDCEGMYMGYNNLGIAYSKVQDIAQAQSHYRQALLKAEDCQSTYGQIMSHHNLGDLALRSGDRDLAAFHFGESLKASRKLEDRLPALYPLAGLTRVAIEMEQHRLALQYAKEGYNTAREWNLPKREIVFADLLYRTYKEMGRYADALRQLEVCNQLKDSLSRVEEAKSLSEINLRHSLAQMKQQEAIERAENEAKALQIEMMQLESRRMQALIAFLIIVLLLCVILGLYFYRTMRITRRKNKTIELQKAEIQRLNHYLENKVAERTRHLSRSNQKLREINFHNAHIVRAPLANILALVHLLKEDANLDSQSRKELIDALQDVAENLDRALHSVRSTLEEGEA